MKKILFFVLLGLSFDVYANDIDYDTLSIIIKNSNLDFSIFPTKNIWNKTQYSPVLDTSKKRNYRTIITEASKLEPNFDGKYRIVEFGTGSSAQLFFIIDLNKGNVYEGIQSTDGIKYSINSSLIVINDPEVLKGWQNGREIYPIGFLLIMFYGKIIIINIY